MAKSGCPTTQTVRSLYGGKDYPPSSWAIAVEEDEPEE